MTVFVDLKLLYPDAKRPEYQTAGASGLDLHAYIPRAQGRQPEALRIPALGRLLVGTGVSLAIPTGYEGQVRPRSGWALSDGLTVLNSPGTIDSDYRGEVKVLLVNLGSSAVTIHTGDRIAQLVIVPVAHAVLQPVEAFADTARGAAGFGSTGKK
jgi:dUTP pyrophosphatase